MVNFGENKRKNEIWERIRKKYLKLVKTRRNFKNLRFLEINMLNLEQKKKRHEAIICMGLEKGYL